MLDDVLNSSVFILVAAGAVAVAAIALQPDPRVVSAEARPSAAPSAVAAASPDEVVQLPTVVIQGRRLQPGDEMVAMAEQAKDPHGDSRVTERGR